jgi:anthraniloyl-CoA monooxygenase
MKIRILGAGPAGLWLARSLKRHDPSCDIAIVEQNPAGATYGFGVVFSSTALDFLERSDPAALTELKAQMQVWDGMTIAHRGWRGCVRARALPFITIGASTISRTLPMPI